MAYTNASKMHVRLSTVSQHMQQVMQTHIRQHIVAYLKRYLKYMLWLPYKDKRLADSLKGIEWLCTIAGAEAMSTAAVATTVLSHEGQVMQESTARMMTQSG